MKNKLFLMFLMIIATGGIHASEHTHKLRVSTDMIVINNQGLFLNIKGGMSLVQVNAIHHDSEGFYVDEFNLFNLWKCGYCQKYNHNDWNTCQWCDMPRE